MENYNVWISSIIWVKLEKMVSPSNLFTWQAFGLAVGFLAFVDIERCRDQDFETDRLALLRLRIFKFSRPRLIETI